VTGVQTCALPICLTAAVLSEQRVSDRVEQGALAVAVVADDHGGSHVLEVEGLIVPIGEESSQRELERDHATTSSNNSSSNVSTRTRRTSSSIASATYVRAVVATSW